MDELEAAGQKPLSSLEKGPPSMAATSPTAAWVAASSGGALGERCAVESPQRLPRRRQEENSTGVVLASARSISEPRQRLKRPPDKHAGISSPDALPKPHQHGVKHNTRLPAVARQRLEAHNGWRQGAGQLPVSPALAVSSRGGLAHGHARSISLDGKSRSAVHLAGRYDAEAPSAAAAPADIVSPGSLFGPSPT